MYVSRFYSLGRYAGMLVSQNSWLCREACWLVKTVGVGKEVYWWVIQLG